jgi:hypothetical protein
VGASIAIGACHCGRLDTNGLGNGMIVLVESLSVLYRVVSAIGTSHFTALPVSYLCEARKTLEAKSRSQ